MLKHSFSLEVKQSLRYWFIVLIFCSVHLQMSFGILTCKSSVTGDVSLYDGKPANVAWGKKR